MPFDTLQKVSDKDKYIKTLRKEFTAMEEGALADFWFFDDVKLGSDTSPVILVGTVGPVVTAAFKKQTQVRASGKCFREGNKLKLSLVKGKMPEVKLKDVFKLFPSIGYKLVAGDLSAPLTKAEDELPNEEKKVRSLIGQLESRFDKIKKAVGDDNRKTLRVIFGNISDALDQKNYKQARTLCKQLNDKMDEFSEQVTPGSTSTDPREKTNAEQRWKKAMARFDKVKGKISDEDRKALRKLWGVAEDFMEKEDWAKAIKAVDAADEDMVKRVKATAEAERQSIANKNAQAEGNATDDEANILRQRIAAQTSGLETMKKAVDPYRVKLQQIRDDLHSETAELTRLKDAAEDTLDPAAMLDLHQQISVTAAACKQIKASLDQQMKLFKAAQQKVDNQRKLIDATVAALKKKKFDKDPALARQIQGAEDRLRDLDEVLDTASIGQAQANLKETVQLMAEATAWRKERLKEEASSHAHGTGRHDAQTGLERQARRAATTEEYDDGSGKIKQRKVNVGGKDKVIGTAPDHEGNEAGTAQKITTWNGIKLTYTEENGKRVIKDRKKSAEALLGAANPGTDGSSTGSMWATPVLEKEAYDTALAYANKLKDYTHRQKSGGQWLEFNSVTIKLGKPKKGPGWGYAVKKTAMPAVADAENILIAFEDGKITLDQLFRRMSVELLSDDGGAKMIPGATVVLNRTDSTKPWKLLTQYPNADLSGTGWEPFRNASGSIKFRKGTSDPGTMLNVDALP